MFSPTAIVYPARTSFNHGRIVQIPKTLDCQVKPDNDNERIIASSFA